MARKGAKKWQWNGKKRGKGQRNGNEMERRGAKK